MRPRALDEVLGQGHLLGAGKVLRSAIETGELHSMILWGPPGSGKTTLARLMAHTTGARFIAFSAVLAGVKEIREVVVEAERAHARQRSEEHTSELQSHSDLVCRLLLEKKNELSTHS